MKNGRCEFCDRLLYIPYVVDACKLEFCNMECLDLFEDGIEDILRDERAYQILRERGNKSTVIQI